MEMGAAKVWGEVGRWLVIALIQLAKYVGTVGGRPWVGVTKASCTDGVQQHTSAPLPASHHPPQPCHTPNPGQYCECSCSSGSRLASRPHPPSFHWTGRRRHSPWVSGFPTRVECEHGTALCLYSLPINGSCLLMEHFCPCQFICSHHLAFYSEEREKLGWDRIRT